MAEPSTPELTPDEATRKMVALLAEPPQWNTQRPSLTSLFQAGANPNVSLGDGTPLVVHVVKNAGNFSAGNNDADIFLKHPDLDVNKPDKKGLTAIFHAGDVAIVSDLIEAGADLLHRNNDGLTVLEYRIGNYPTDDECMDLGIYGAASIAEQHLHINLLVRNHTWLQEQRRDGGFDADAWRSLQTMPLHQGSNDANYQNIYREMWRKTLPEVLAYGAEGGPVKPQDIISRETALALSRSGATFKGSEILGLLQLCEANHTLPHGQDLHESGLLAQMSAQKKIHYLFQNDFWEGKEFPQLFALYQSLPESYQSQAFTDRPGAAKDMAKLCQDWLDHGNTQDYSVNSLRSVIRELPEPVKDLVGWKRFMLELNAREQEKSPVPGRL